VSPRVLVDETRCVGSGDCALAAPEAFDVDEDAGLARVLPGAQGVDDARLQRAAYACPTGALRLAD
jgi:ferredoxin